jgi:Lrp/AsnC family transcriptional regulator, leucine-responsive regulatory protein
MENETGHIDEIDRHMLRILQGDGRISVASLADQVGISEAPCWRRLKRLQSTGYITGFNATASRRKLGYDVHAFVHVKFSTHDMVLAQEFEKRVMDLSEVLTCHNVTGEVDYILQVIAEDLDAYGAFTVVLRNLPGVTAIHSSLSLREIKSSHAIPVNG